MVKCTVKKCTSRSNEVNRACGVSFHAVPKDPKRMQEWIINIRLLRKETDWLPSSTTVICSKHFLDSDIIAPKNDKGIFRLSNKAIPIVIDTPKSSIEGEDDLDVETDEEMREVLETSEEHKMRLIIRRLELIASNRLKVINKFKKRNQRLIKKNRKLSDIIKEIIKR